MPMRKPKLYLDTSVISHLSQPDAPEKMADTLELWEDIKAGMYEVYVSNVTLREVFACKPEKLDILIKHLSDIEYTVIDETEEIRSVAEKIIELGILRQKSYDDCMHIASAVVTSCDYIASWNFKHMVNVKTVHGVRAITNLHGYKSIDIVPPNMLLHTDDAESEE